MMIYYSTHIILSIVHLKILILQIISGLMHGIPIVITKQTPYGKVSITTKLTTHHSIRHSHRPHPKFKTQYQQYPSAYQSQINHQSLQSEKLDSITSYSTKINPKLKQNKLRIKRIQSSRNRRRFPEDFFVKHKQEEDQEKVNILQAEKNSKAELEEYSTPKFVGKQSAKSKGRVFQTQKLHSIQKSTESSSNSARIKVFSIKHKKNKPETHRKTIENMKQKDNFQINNLSVQSIRIPGAQPNKNYQNTTFGKEQWSTSKIPQKQNLLVTKGHEREPFPSLRSVNVPKICGRKEKSAKNLLGKIGMRQ